MLVVQLAPRHSPPSQVGVAAGQVSGRSIHAPLALQTRRIREPAAPQLAAPHDEFTGSRRQPPLPSQPLVQVPAVHMPVGSAPRAGTLAQVPSCPGSAHDLQDPAQAVAQQRP